MDEQARAQHERLKEHPVIANLIERARGARKRIVLPETQDPRVLRAARQITDEGYAHVVLCGEEGAVRQLAAEHNTNLNDVEIVNHVTDDRRDEYIGALYEKRKHKGMSRHSAAKLLSRPVYYGAMMVGSGQADGMVAGSVCPTRDVVRGALFGVGCVEGSKSVSSCTIMNTVMHDLGADGSLIFADTGVIPEPNSEQLADIAVAAADACQSLLDVEPIVAMLSFSTKGSAYSPAVQRVQDATEMVKQRRPELTIDGELQVDSALIPEVAARKASDSPVAGKANTLVFPDLSCGNIAYKLVERLGGATALGPLLTGLAKPVNDLSRGCDVLDLMLITAITAIQAS
ncbi:MAG: phosphate acetyltransferase [Planctomycetota bacterium]|jgi:phosphate acetyltransferase